MSTRPGYMEWLAGVPSPTWFLAAVSLGCGLTCPA